MTIILLKMFSLFGKVRLLVCSTTTTVKVGVVEHVMSRSSNIFLEKDCGPSTRAQGPDTSNLMSGVEGDRCDTLTNIRKSDAFR